MRQSGHRRALGALFFVLAALFAGIAVASAASAEGATAWIVPLAAGAIALWFLTLVARAWRRS